MTSDPAMPENPRAQREGPPPPAATPAPDTSGPVGAAPEVVTARAADATRQPASEPRPRTTRAGVVWVAVVVALLALILLIVFILQNQQPVTVLFLGLEGTVALGMALFIAAVAGGVLVAAAGAARIIQLRSNARRIRKAHNRP